MVVFLFWKQKVIDWIENEFTSWESEVLPKLSSIEMNAYKHKDFWQPMDTLR